KNVVDMMMMEGVNFGGEQSGHIIFSDYAKTGDGLASALLALAYLSTSNKSASDLFNPFELYPQKLVNLNISNKKEIESLNGIEELKAKIESLNMRHLFRYSGTENKIRLLLEGKEKSTLDTMMQETVAFFTKALS
ncbi:MAG: phosphoglucosamine mutase, partial [Sulfurovaceae bacterium]